MSDNGFYNPPQEGGGGGGSGSRWGVSPSPHQPTIPNHGPSSTMVNSAPKATNSVFFSSEATLYLNYVCLSQEVNFIFSGCYH